MSDREASRTAPFSLAHHMKSRSALRPLGRAFKEQSLCRPHIQSRFQSTSGHVVPPLIGGKDEIFNKYGVPGFLSAQTYRSSWLDYQKHLCNYINTQVSGTPYERLPVRQLHEQLSRRPADAHLYNYAAQAHHNHFFYNTLSANPDPMFPAAGLSQDVGENFESLQHLRDELTDAAMAMFGQGYVWLMKEMSTQKTLWILCTYNAGSPFPAAHSRRQTRDAATGQDLGNRMTEPQNYAGSMGQHSQTDPTYHAGALKAMPILCLKVWEHQWLPDYGVLGKEAYVKNWWNRIDWDQVLNNYNLVPDEERQFSAARVVTPNRATGSSARYLETLERPRW